MVQVDTTILLQAGLHCLTVEVFNLGAVAMGFALEGEVIGADLLTSSCCRNNGRICGNKFLDGNCDGIVTVNDPVLSGWQIELRNSSNVVIATATTDAHGNYCFTNLPAGNYTVNEVLQAGYNQSYPATPGTHSISLTANNSVLAHFGNCQDPPEPCDFDLSFTYVIDKCRLSFTPQITNIPAGYQVVSTHWVFGDGTSSDAMFPVHFFENTIFHNVCLTVTIFNGTECCTKTFCEEILIHEPCEGGCEIDAKIIYDLDPTTCVYDFSLMLNYSGLPIHTLFWEFGDGTTGSGWNPSHHFACNGVYNVCVTLFATGPDGECCFRKFCLRVKVDCTCCDDATDPAGSPSPQQSPSGKIKSDLKAGQGTNDLKLYPNPNDGGFNVIFTLAESSAVSLSVMDMKGGKVYEKQLGQLTPGEHNLHAQANLPPGIYVCEIIAGEVTYRTNLVVTK